MRFSEKIINAYGDNVLNPQRNPPLDTTLLRQKHMYENLYNLVNKHVNAYEQQINDIKQSITNLVRALGTDNSSTFNFSELYKALDFITKDYESIKNLFMMRQAQQIDTQALTEKLKNYVAALAQKFEMLGRNIEKMAQLASEKYGDNQITQEFSTKVDEAIDYINQCITDLNTVYNSDLFNSKKKKWYSFW